MGADVPEEPAALSSGAMTSFMKSMAFYGMMLWGIWGHSFSAFFAVLVEFRDFISRSKAVPVVRVRAQIG
jgi:hypothetical protein